MLRLSLLFTLALLATPFADDWGSVATVSTTMGVQEGRLCIGEGSRGDIGCPSYAPTVSPTGTLNTTAVSLTTSGVTWGYLASTASYVPNLSTNALTVGGLTLTSTSLVSATAQVAFSAHRNGTNQTVTNNGYTKILFTTEDFDTNNNFDLATSRFTPTVPGKYFFQASGYCSDNTVYCLVAIYKNGTMVKAGFARASTAVLAEAVALLDMNGTTDYAEAYIYNNGGTTLNGYTYYTRFSGALFNGSGSSDGTPTGQISAFDLAACPAGWSEYTPARGRFLRGIDSTGAVDPDGARTAGTSQEDAFRSHTHWSASNSANVNTFSLKQEAGSYTPSIYGSIGTGAGTGSSANQWTWTNSPAGSGTETRPKNVAVLFCRKD